MNGGLSLSVRPVLPLQLYSCLVAKARCRHLLRATARLDAASARADASERDRPGLKSAHNRKGRNTLVLFAHNGIACHTQNEYDANMPEKNNSSLRNNLTLHEFRMSE